MEANQAWQLFMQTGQVDAYLTYKRLIGNIEDAEEELPDADEDRWDYPSGSHVGRIG